MEYAALILLVAAILVAVISSGLARQIPQQISSAIECALTPGGECAPEGSGDQPGSGTTAQPESDQGPASGEDSDGVDPASPDGGTSGDVGPEGTVEEIPLWDGGEDSEAVPLLYQPESGNGVTPTHDSYNAVMETVSDDGGNGRDDGYETELTEDGTAGSDPDDEGFDESGLGPPVEGSSHDEDVHPMEWTAPDAHNEHGSKEATEEHEDSHRFWVQIGAMAGALNLDNASKNMIHYLANSGEPLEQDVGDMLNSVDPFKSQVEQEQHELVEEAILRAEEEGGSGPYTFPVRTDWTQHRGNKGEDGMDWFYASGSWKYSQTGDITVIREDDGSWSYEMETEVHMRDQYDWHGADDENLGVSIPFIGQVDDEELAELARAGLAQEYTMYGTSDPVTRSGSYTPDEGLHGERSNGPGTGR